jgi:uncharacterized protein YxeA
MKKNKIFTLELILLAFIFTTIFKSFNKDNIAISEPIIQIENKYEAQTAKDQDLNYKQSSIYLLKHQ